jgi:mannose/cellobiose epimerase-like protein (N-acyl-D-glucosamine 2-epimerase family)
MKRNIHALLIASLVPVAPVGCLRRPATAPAVAPSETAAAAASSAPDGVRVVDIQAILAALPNGERWVRHMNEDLLRFWGTETALGNPVGNFPTYRCNDGSLYDEKAPCPELKNADRSIVKLERDYTRSKSRQVYAYGVAYHLTGDERYLGYAIAGADWLIAHAVDKYGAASWFVAGAPAPANLQRTSQDLAYAATGIAFAYYLTRDAKYLDQVVKLKRHIFSTYFDPSWGILRWVREANADGDDVNQKELVSQLDQIYGYLLWTTMALPPGPLADEWTRDLKSLAVAMRNQFFGETYGLYWGAITDVAHHNLADQKNQENPHTDFGHSIKTLWLTYRIGLLTGDVSLVDFARPHMQSILDAAYVEETGSWARGYKPSAPGSLDWIIDPNKEWWSLAELDQTSATLALVDPRFAERLTRTYTYWFDHMVDHQHGDVWHMVKADGNTPDPSFPKQHSWKNAFHVFEHALIGYLTGQALHGLPIELHYAFKGGSVPRSLHPYLYLGEVASTQANGAFTNRSLAAYTPTRVTYRVLR